MEKIERKVQARACRSRSLAWGTKLYSIDLDIDTSYSVSQKDVCDIQVEMVNGHMFPIPFGLITMSDETRIMVPLHNCRCFTLDGP